MVVSLVTGATGLIGSHLVETLVMRGETVRALVRPTSEKRRLRELGVDIRIGDLADAAALMAVAKGANRIFHCAALVRDWGVEEAFRQANVHGVRNILAAATRAKVDKFVHLSTTDIYGFVGKRVTEKERPAPRGFPYADSKIEAESLVWNHRRRVGLPVCVIRPGTVYGPQAHLFVTDMLEAIRNREAILIDGGHHIAGLTYVGNLVDALILAADSKVAVGEAYNVSDDSDVTWQQYLYTLADVAELPRPTRSHPHWFAYLLATAWENYYHLTGRTERPPMTRMMVETMGTDQVFSIEKAKEQLGYRPRVSFEEGMQHTAAWLRSEGLLFPQLRR
ncbi:MAG: NAD-dependent epimerase/dehydratase family protein [Chloroflexota bacterium]|nr:NAD-dependent epimerase/dehydratase family protein [Chloroflexota bacterium]